jgi:hypothetical protein
MTVINDAGGYLYQKMREVCRGMYCLPEARKFNHGFNVTVRALSDFNSSFGSEIILKNLRITQVGNLQYGH